MHSTTALALATEANKRHASVVGLDSETELFMIDRTVYNRVLRRNINIFHMAENYVALLNTPSDLRSPSDIQILVQMTQQHSVFHQLPLHVMEKLCKSMFLQKHQKSSVIYCQGVPVGMESCFYIVLSGTVSVHTKPGGVRPEDRVVHAGLVGLHVRVRPRGLGLDQPGGGGARHGE